MPPAGFDVKAYKELVMNLPVRNPAMLCPLPAKNPAKNVEEPVFLNGKHERSKGAAPTETLKAQAVGDLSSYFNQQIPFNQIIALGALKKSGSVYVQANGYTEGWDDCSDTPVSHCIAEPQDTC